jgi:hypothetical protein
MPHPAQCYFDANHLDTIGFDVVSLSYPRRTLKMPFMAKRVWVGMNGNWIATIDEQASVLANIYTRQLIKLPPWEGYFFQRHYYGTAGVDSACEDINLNQLTIMICKVPTKAGHFEDYKLIALFDKAFVYLIGRGAWTYLLNPTVLFSQGLYSDAIKHIGVIFLVHRTDGFISCWYPEYGKFQTIFLFHPIVVSLNDHTI